MKTAVPEGARVTLPAGSQAAVRLVLASTATHMPLVPKTVNPNKPELFEPKLAPA